MLTSSLAAGAWNWWPLPMAEPDTCRDTIVYVSEISALASSGKEAPSLLWHRTDGNISPMPYSGNLSAGIVKQATRPSRWFDYDFGVVLTGRVSGSQHNIEPRLSRGTGYFRQLYAHVRLYIVDITAGIKPLPCGAGDADLTSGSLLSPATPTLLRVSVSGSTNTLLSPVCSATPRSKAVSPTDGWRTTRLP